MYLNCLCILLCDYSKFNFNITENERLKWESSRRGKFYSLTKELSVGVSQREEVKEGNYTGVAQVTKLQPVLINIHDTHSSAISRAGISTFWVAWSGH